ncbi:hypothetical protein [Paenibacillus sp. NAIST15-1]|uniref:dioxygenase family protein n=1 Tax=Paenibacillus sp. NAIST15-1 TaxID=1605994 RepID=UPI000933C25F|nr:hypothetical protein [Paenibacillus sp. NAIST15-1]
MGCRPICGLTVDIWNSNTCGVYSGFSGYENSHFAPGQTATPTDHKTFLRGRRFTDENGMVEFLTIIPAWYHLRTPHIHIKIFEDSKDILTTQLFFPQEFTYEIESLSPYNSRQLSPYINENEVISSAGKFLISLEGLVDTSSGNSTNFISGFTPAAYEQVAVISGIGQQIERMRM